MENENNVVEEKWNAYSHAFGALLGILGGLVLISQVKHNHQFWPVLIYSASVILLFAASTSYHAVNNPSLKKKLRIVDHISIYYLIAGSYTPICLWILKDSKGNLLLVLVWLIALAGTIIKLFFTGRFEVFSLLLYGIMGWLIVIDLPFLLENMNEKGIFYLSLGGAFYTVGMVFYAIKKIPFNHLIWHFFVLSGAISHWFMINILLR